MIQVQAYKKGYAITGDTYQYRGKLKQYGARFNRHLEVGVGWVVSSANLTHVCNGLGILPPTNVVKTNLATQIKPTTKLTKGVKPKLDIYLLNAFDFIAYSCIGRVKKESYFIWGNSYTKVKGKVTSKKIHSDSYKLDNKSIALTWFSKSAMDLDTLVVGLMYDLGIELHESAQYCEYVCNMIDSYNCSKHYVQHLIECQNKYN